MEKKRCMSKPGRPLLHEGVSTHFVGAPAPCCGPGPLIYMTATVPPASGLKGNSFDDFIYYPCVNSL
jgi:hypothetical protein